MIRRPCSKCGSTDIPKPLKKKIRHDRGGKVTYWRSTVCLVCIREDFKERYYEKIKLNPAQYQNHLRHNKLWQKRNREKVSYYQKEWELRNKEKRRRQKREYYLLNREKILAKNKIWKDANRKKSETRLEHIWRQWEQERIQNIRDKYARRDKEVAGNPENEREKELASTASTSHF